MSRIIIIFRKAQSVFWVVDIGLRDLTPAREAFAAGCVACVQVDGQQLTEEATNLDSLMRLVQEAHASLAFRCVGCGI